MKLSLEIQSTVSHQYALGVLSGEVHASSWVRKQVERYFSWIDTAVEGGYYMDHAAGNEAVQFFPTCLRHTKGSMKGQPFELAPFQQFTIYNLFAWKSVKTGLRRINTVYDKRAKKNGKSAEMAGLALYAISFDMESSAEAYVGATKEEQAKICWNQAAAFINHPMYGSPQLKQIGFRVLQSKILFPKFKGVLRALGGDSKTQDGINTHIAIIDEYHAHRDDTVKENLESSTVMRSQPIVYHITTAGFETSGVCKLYEDTCKDVLDGHKSDDHLWIMIHDLDEGDDWENESNWYKANPLLSKGLPIENLRKEYTKAKNQPSKIPNFKTKHLNMWVDSSESWVSSEDWDRGSDKVKLSSFIEFGCAGAMDLSTNKDLTALAFVSNPDNEGYRDLLVVSFCPKDTIDRRSKEDKVPYRFWADIDYDDYVDFTGTDVTTLKGLGRNGKLKVLTATPGNVIDYECIEDIGISLYGLLKAKWMDYDRRFADYLVNRFESAGMEMHPFSQMMSHYSFPMKELEKDILSGKLRHGGNPVLRWSVSGVVTVVDTNENIRPDKGRSTKRIDPIVASIMAYSGTITDGEEKSKYSQEDADIYV